MKVSELIEKLEKTLKDCGDINVVVALESTHSFKIQQINYYAEGDPSLEENPSAWIVI